mmetsp:Transcript_6962/g.9057  ORF Transcript_6962/g.9057 Transcript_6962/m.9057 type:complete len:105 (+) Transcript_6962:83-397(+)
MVHYLKIHCWLIQSFTLLTRSDDDHDLPVPAVVAVAGTIVICLSSSEGVNENSLDAGADASASASAAAEMATDASSLLVLLLNACKTERAKFGNSSSLNLVPVF